MGDHRKHHTVIFVICILLFVRNTTAQGVPVGGGGGMPGGFPGGGRPVGGRPMFIGDGHWAAFIGEAKGDGEQIGKVEFHTA